MIEYLRSIKKNTQKVLENVEMDEQYSVLLRSNLDWCDELEDHFTDDGR